MQNSRLSYFFIIIFCVVVSMSGCDKLKTLFNSEHAGDEHAGDGENGVSAAQIKKSMMDHIRSSEKQGVFEIQDPDNDNSLLKLKFVKIHDPVRKIEGKGFFACTDFQVMDDEPGKRYDLDFWLSLQGDSLSVTKTTIHKHPIRVNGKWEKKARYTFVDDEPVIIK